LVHKAGKRCAYKLLVGKSEEKRPLGKPTHKTKDNIKSYFEELIGLIWLSPGTSGTFSVW
jgi:hypothetical protein